MGDSMLDGFSCPICFELAEDAVETSCCHHVFCQPCLHLVQVDGKPCPQCRQNFTSIVSHVSRRIIGNIPVECNYQGCTLRIGKSELKAHQAKCPHRQFKCPGCMFQGRKNGFAQHLAKDHADLVVQNAAKVFENPGAAEQKENQKEDRINARLSAAGRRCRLGSSGKFYCGAALNGPRCGCCNGNCGPTNGCNCANCMKFDIVARKLPRHWYVNRDGAPARKSPTTGHFYCGRCVIPRSARCDGYCGPTDGPNCEACRILEFQIPYRYADIWPDEEAW